MRVGVGSVVGIFVAAALIGGFPNVGAVVVGLVGAGAKVGL